MAISNLPLRTDLIIAAAETDDDVGLVLRCHLHIEGLLTWFVAEVVMERKLRAIIPPVKTFGSALAFAAAFGMPVQHALAIKQLNNIRNKLAHGAQDLQATDVKTFADAVDRIAEVDPTWEPLGKRYVELPIKYPGKRLRFGEHSIRTDFLMVTLCLQLALSLWLEGPYARRLRGLGPLE